MTVEERPTYFEQKACGHSLRWAEVRFKQGETDVVARNVPLHHHTTNYNYHHFIRIGIIWDSELRFQLVGNEKWVQSKFNSISMKLSFGNLEKVG